MKTIHGIGLVMLSAALVTSAASAETKSIDLGKIADRLKGATGPVTLPNPTQAETLQAATTPTLTAPAPASTPVPVTNAELVLFIDMTAKGASAAEIAAALDKLRTASTGK
jgi:hypothetical protein